MFCPECGKEISQTWKFCLSCGTQLDLEVATHPQTASGQPSRPAQAGVLDVNLNSTPTRPPTDPIRSASGEWRGQFKTLLGHRCFTVTLRLFPAADTTHGIVYFAGSFRPDPVTWWDQPSEVWGRYDVNSCTLEFIRWLGPPPSHLQIGERSWSKIRTVGWHSIWVNPLFTGTLVGDARIIGKWNKPGEGRGGFFLDRISS